PGGDRASRRVDVEADVAARVLGRQQQQLGAEPVRHPVVNLGAEHDDALVEEPGGQLVIEHPGERCGLGHGSLHSLPALRSGAGHPAAPSTMVRAAGAGQDNLPTAEKHRPADGRETPAAGHPPTAMICSATAARSGPMMSGWSPSGLRTIPGRATNAARHPALSAPVISQAWAATSRTCPVPTPRARATAW